MGQGLGSSSSAPQIVDEKALAITGKSKGKEKRKKDGKKNLYVSKVKFFICHKQGHFSSKCLNRKKKSKIQMDGSAEVDEFSRNFDEEFCLIASMASTVVLKIVPTGIETGRFTGSELNRVKPVG